MERLQASDTTRFIEEYRFALQNMLLYSVAPHFEGRRNDRLSIVSAACGIGLEMKPLRRIFSHAVIQGIDVDPSKIIQAANVNRDVKDIKYVIGDFTQPGLFHDRSCDLVFMRNPQVFGTLKDPSVRDTWKSIIHRSAKMTADKGIMCYTTTTEEEMDFINDALSTDGVGQMLHIGPNRFAVTGKTFSEAFVGLARPKK